MVLLNTLSGICHSFRKFQIKRMCMLRVRFLWNW